ncbi:hypothetical protein FEM03_12055 [Phragmitibacter flavus]|uniref:Uncharacterized protein n=1 Tax=Phragmitibacter flavus TaxID=2576071 RepID=A0A5R8KEP2_9BACT|nr:hypothetical protein [Phragmitibacter flavus]TLD70455.1 hypothetical protein FEM03_12055 [Phragmitibacter flavus]
MKIKTLEQAHKFVLKVKVCLIFGSKKSTLPSLWDMVDLPGRQPGQKGWGRKVEAIWAWKNELPAQFPSEIFYGKLPGGLAVLMCTQYLREEHYPQHHKPVSDCGPLARRAYELIRRESRTTAELRRELSTLGGVSKSRIDTALVELQVTLNIVRSNAPGLKTDTWLPFFEQHPEFLSDD